MFVSKFFKVEFLGPKVCIYSTLQGSPCFIYNLFSYTFYVTFYFTYSRNHGEIFNLPTWVLKV